MGPRPILPIKVPITISTMLNFNRPDFGVATCEQAFSVQSNRDSISFTSHLLVFVDKHGENAIGSIN